MTDLLATALSVYRGERVTIPFALTVPDNVTGQLWVFTLATRQNLATKLLVVDLVWDDVAQGVGHVTLDTADTDIYPGTSHFWDVWRLDEGFEQPYAIGSLKILINVAHPVAPAPLTPHHNVAV